MWLSIGAVSAIDVYWSIKLKELLYETELNPIGKWIMYMDGGDVSLFMGLKVFGTVLVLGVLFYAFVRNRKMAWILIIPIFIFQVALLAFLYTF